MAEKAQVPYSWVGRQIEAGIVEWRHTEMGVPMPLHGGTYTGTLELVNALGIMATLHPQGEEAAYEALSKFYPWSSVISLHPAKSSL
jgi:hypothetical protein